MINVTGPIIMEFTPEELAIACFAGSKGKTLAETPAEATQAVNVNGAFSPISNEPWPPKKGEQDSPEEASAGSEYCPDSTESSPGTSQEGGSTQEEGNDQEMGPLKANEPCSFLTLHSLAVAPGVLSRAHTLRASFFAEEGHL